MRIRLGELRKAKGMSQGELAEKVDISRGFMNQLENGKRTLKPDMQARLAAALGVHPSEVIDFDGPEASDVEAIVDAFSSLGPQQRKAVLSLAQSLRPGSEKP